MNKQLRELVEIIHFTEKVSAKIHGLLDEAKIFQIVKKEFAKSKKYTASILLVSDDSDLLEIRTTSASPGAIKIGEKIVKFRMKDYKIDLNKSSIYSQVIKKGKTVRIGVNDVVGELFPRPIAYLISKKMGYEKSECIITPLRKKKKIIGALAMSSTELAEYFTPSVKNLAQHISTALDLASECAEHKKTGEALRKAHDELEKRVEKRTAELAEHNTLLIQEIINHNKARQEARESEVKFKNIFESANDCIVYLDRNGRIADVNKKTVRIFGKPKREVVGKHFSKLDMFYGQEISSLIEYFKKVLAGGKVVLELCFRGKRGQKIFLECSASRVNAGNKASGVMFIGRDISERKQAEEMLKKNRKQLKVYSESLEKTVEERTEKLSQLVESQKEFITDIGHELRTPLSVIKAVVETELDDASKPLGKQLKLIDKKVDQITRILKNLMLVSRLDIGQEQIQKTRFKLRKLLTEVLDDVIQEAHRENMEPKVRLSCPKSTELNSDRTKASVVLTNLLKNAIVHSDGKPNISLRARKHRDDIQVVVEDNNQPIPKKELKRIFEKFYRSKQAKRKIESSGLGLYISKRLIELMQGKIWAESEKGIGNRFIVQLPVSS